METDVAVAKKRRVGRPRRLTLEQVIAAAMELGLDRVDMVSVAQRLGIGVATLYGYVEGREHLVRLVADRLAHRAAIEDHGQGWDDALREHAERTFAVYRGTPQLIPQLMSGLLGGLAENDFVEGLLATLVARGIAPDRALTLFLQVNQLVLGAAVGAAYIASLNQQAGSEEARTAQLREDCDRFGRPQLQAALRNVDLMKSAGDFRSGLERLIAYHRAEMVRA